VGRDYGLNDMAQVRDSWRVLINAIMNYWLPYVYNGF
jgi:hypothetical protein